MSEINEINGAALIEVLGAGALTTVKWDDVVTESTVSFPMDDFISLGTTFLPLAKEFSVAASHLKGNGTLYEVTVPKGAHLAAAKDGSGLLGAVVKDGKGVVGQARFHEVQGGAQSGFPGPSLFTALALMSIKKSLKNIEETQKGILQFLEIDKETQLKGNLNALAEIIGDYHHNWNNAQYLSNRENQVLEIKRNAEQNMLFYREMIDTKLGKQKLIHLDTSKMLTEIEAKFKYYQLSLYLYSFSSFLDVMLLGNFDRDYLTSVAQKVRQYALDYDAFYEKAVGGVEKIAATSVQSRALQGLSIAGKFVGKQVGKIQDKEEIVAISEKIMSGSGKLEEKNSQLLTDTKESFKVVQDNGIGMFVEKIEFINAIYNDRLSIAFDGEKMYLNVGATQ